MPDISSLVSFLTFSSVSLSSPCSLGIYISSQNSDNRVSYLGPWPAPETVPHISQGESLKQHGSTAVWCESSIIQPCLLWATWSYRIAGKISNGAKFFGIFTFFTDRWIFCCITSLRYIQVYFGCWLLACVGHAPCSSHGTHVLTFWSSALFICFGCTKR